MLTELPTEEKYINQWQHKGIVYRFSWLGNVPQPPDRVYALAFTAEGQMLLVTDENWTPACWLPGGGIEAGETPEQALARELIEEANAKVVKSVRIGIQQTDSSEGYRSFQAFYWCRVEVEEQFAPTHEVTERHLIAPNSFLDTLFWGRSDPKAEMLLDLALEIESKHTRGK
ncbi:MAG: NUDIX hydrolase [Chloroflexota bacterium]